MTKQVTHANLSRAPIVDTVHRGPLVSYCPRQGRGVLMYREVTRWALIAQSLLVVATNVVPIATNNRLYRLAAERYRKASSHTDLSTSTQWTS